MGRAIHRLSEKEIARSDAATLCDGGGLYLMRSGRAAASWILRFARGGRSHDLGLGSFPELGLKRARDKAFNLRRALAEGVDILAERRAQRAAAAPVAMMPKALTLTFAEAAAQYIAGRERGWSRSHSLAWSDTL